MFDGGPNCTLTLNVYDGVVLQKLVESLLDIVRCQQATIGMYENRFQIVETAVAQNVSVDRIQLFPDVGRESARREIKIEARATPRL